MSIDLPQMRETILRHYQQGQLSEAERLCRSVLEQQQDAEVLHLLGVVLFAQRRLDESLSCLQYLVEQTQHPNYRNTLGGVLLAARRYAEASRCYQALVKQQPQDAVAMHNLALALQGEKRLDEALEAAQHALELLPTFNRVKATLGGIYLALDRLELAKTSLGLAVQVEPHYAPAWQQLGVTLQRLRERKLAIQAFQRAIQEQPNLLEAYCGLAACYVELEQYQEAIPPLQMALQLRPQHLPALLLLVTAYRGLKQITDALNVLQPLAQQYPNSAEVWIEASLCAQVQQHLSQALEYTQQALACDPKSSTAYKEQGLVYLQMGQVEPGLEALQQCFALNINPANCSQYLFHMNYCSKLSAAELLDAAAMYEQHFPVQAGDFAKHDRDPQRRLRIAYVSPDFRWHSVAYFIQGIFAAHDRKRFELYAYSLSHQQDGMSEFLRQQVHVWRSCAGMNASTLAEQIRQDKIDILVDLAGHTSKNALAAIILRPAPVQMTYLGYPGSTGLKAFDYRLSDQYADPLGNPSSEAVLHLPHSYFCYRPASSMKHLAVQAPPMLSKHKVCFGSFNNHSKITCETLNFWAQVLNAAEDSRLIIKNRSVADMQVQQRVLKQFAEHGIDFKRIQFMPYAVSTEQHLELYHQVDIALDTWPYNGATTTCEALWMGVPVLSLSGERHASRMGLSILHTVGLADWVSDEVLTLVEKVQQVLQAPETLCDLRFALRERLLSSPIGKAHDFTANLERLYRQAWQTYCISESNNN